MNIPEVFGVVIVSDGREWVAAPFFAPFAIRILAPSLVSSRFVLALHMPN